MIFATIASLHFKQVIESLKKVGRKQKSTKPAEVINKVEVLSVRLVIMYVHFMC